ncbi:LuxR C-terminal-related transcriptional regulator [Alkalimarinus sediminis]|uniref:Response regulator transcription factor n=1 Tax=Alkalimarinus sediminis TaxID=1632866 RepID=A0A9E8HHK3_9ALTE|nr:response regulator transcription factor [Alkalimarinus sediminis]UZW74805.1 response regulator transcription factor [Alkalimarinus sediminis]
MKIKIVLIDDHTLFREGLGVLLSAYSHELELVGSFGSSKVALEKLSSLKPDIVLCDVRMPGLDGDLLCNAILKKCPYARLISVSASVDVKTIDRMLAAGSSGYVIKESGISVVMKAITEVMNGVRFLDPMITQATISSHPSYAPNEELSPRERQVAKLLAEGLTTHQISDHLNISIKTVETHRSHIFKKLGITNIAHLVRFAIRTGLIES